VVGGVAETQALLGDAVMMPPMMLMGDRQAATASPRTISRRRPWPRRNRFRLRRLAAFLGGLLVDQSGGQIGVDLCLPGIELTGAGATTAMRPEPLVMTASSDH
jgi:hypothetical protein